jgi:hypothetical protein
MPRPQTTRLWRTCPTCAQEYWTVPSRLKIGRGKFCSAKCAGYTHEVTTPPSEKIARVRANGLINERIKAGTLKRPDSCQQCGKAGRVDAHHEDYSKPDAVEFLCRSCHMKRHHKPRKQAS